MQSVPEVDGFQQIVHKQFRYILNLIVHKKCDNILPSSFIIQHKHRSELQDIIILLKTEMKEN